MTDKDRGAMRIPPRPERKPAATVDEFVTGKAATKRLTMDIPAELHTRIKIGAAREGVTMAEAVIAALDKRFPA